MIIKNLSDKSFMIFTITGKLLYTLLSTPHTCVEIKGQMLNFGFKDGISLSNIEIIPNLPPKRDNIIYVISGHNLPKRNLNKAKEVIDDLRIFIELLKK